MSVRDLRDWIATLEKAGELVRVSAPVDPKLEITEIADRVSTSASRGPRRAAIAAVVARQSGTSPSRSPPATRPAPRAIRSASAETTNRSPAWVMRTRPWA